MFITLVSESRQTRLNLCSIIRAGSDAADPHVPQKKPYSARDTVKLRGEAFQLRLGSSRIR